MQRNEGVSGIPDDNFLIKPDKIKRGTAHFCFERSTIFKMHWETLLPHYDHVHEKGKRFDQYY